ncbi:hypothetical protein [Anaeroselena agilis]|uniref:Internal virion protein C n=1 Tax=Anaeroselena agilis TaxID=3063788 RepID=A0ABU3NXU4_9FIRM|nr:hypothetical protein [Selenomonadales bacterium 4137-cl]
MADLVGASIGTEKQFAGNPAGLYQKRLTGVSVDTPTASGMDLANALGVLGDTLAYEGVASEKRKEKSGVAAAERIAAAASEEDLKKLTAIELIGNYGKDRELQDNPYAVSTIERMRGRYFAAQLKDEYASWRLQQPKLKSADEELQQFNKFRQEHYAKVGDVSLDRQAFDRGYNEKNLVNQLDFASQFRTEQALELKAIQKGSAKAALGELMSHYSALPPEDFIKGLNNVFADARISWMSIPERMELAQEAFKSIATAPGDYERIKKVASEVIIGVDRNGKPVKAGDNIDIEPFRLVAEQRTASIFGERVQRSLEDLQKMSIPEQRAQYAKWQREDPAWFNVMAPYQDNAYKYRRALEQKAQVSMARQMTTATAQTMQSSIIQRQLRAYLEGSMTDSSGDTVAASKGALPTPGVPGVDVNGNPKTQKLTWDDAFLNATIRNEIATIQNSATLSEDQKTAEVMKRVLFPPFEDFRKSLRMTVNSAVDSLAVSKITTKADGAVELPPALQKALDMSRVNPEAFHSIVGDEAYQKVETIKHLAQGLNGDWKQAVALYALGRENSKDKEFVRLKDKELADVLNITRLDGFKDLDGNLVKADVALGTNRPIMQRVEEIAKWLVYAGKAPADAVVMAKDSVRQTMYVWESAAMPKQVFAGINTDRKAEIGKKVLEDYMNEFLQNTGTERKYVAVSYMPDENALVFQGGGGYMKRTANDIAYSGNLYLGGPQEKRPRIPTISAEDVNRQRAAAEAANVDNGANLSSESQSTLP